MAESLIVKRLKDVDRALHSIMDELEPKSSVMSLEELREAMNKSAKSLSLSELNKVMERDRLSEEDSTKLIRKMRDRKYDL